MAASRRRCASIASTTGVGGSAEPALLKWQMFAAAGVSARARAMSKANSTGANGTPAGRALKCQSGRFLLADSNARAHKGTCTPGMPARRPSRSAPASFGLRGAGCAPAFARTRGRRLGSLRGRRQRGRDFPNPLLVPREPARSQVGDDAADPIELGAYDRRHVLRLEEKQAWHARVFRFELGHALLERGRARFELDAEVVRPEKRSKGDRRG